MLDKSFADLRMDQTRLPADATAVTATQSQALKDGEVLADDGASYATVQDAENAASSWIRLPPATFSESVTIDTAGLTVVGAGYDTLVDGGTDSHALQVSGVENVTISNLSVKSVYSSSGPGDNAIDVSGTGVKNTLIKNITVRDSAYAGVRFRAGSDHAVLNSVVESAKFHGVQGQKDVPRVLYSGLFVLSTTDAIGININGDDSVCSGCIVKNTGGDGIRIQRANDTTCGGCRVHNAGSNGIASTQMTDIIVYNNRISGSTNSDLSLGGTNPVSDANLTGSAN